MRGSVRRMSSSSVMEVSVARGLGRSGGGLVLEIILGGTSSGAMISLASRVSSSGGADRNAFGGDPIVGFYPESRKHSASTTIEPVQSFRGRGSVVGVVCPRILASSIGFRKKN